MEQNNRLFLKFLKHWSSGLVIVLFQGLLWADSGTLNIEQINACVVEPDVTLTTDARRQIAACLGWQEDAVTTRCSGQYQAFSPDESLTTQTVITADQVSLYSVGQSELSGHVELKTREKIVTAQTATVYRDPATQKIVKIELKDNVHYLEPKRSIWAKKVMLNPDEESGRIEEVLYRIDDRTRHGALPAWGIARFAERFKNKDTLFKDVTYTTCPPQTADWQIAAREIQLEDARARGVAKDATLRLHDIPVLYTPYLSFPTNKDRQTGFLMPIYGYSNIGGVDLAAPFYWNIAPNYDATLIPHFYSLRGVMLGGEGRFLTEHTLGALSLSILPNDRAYQHFINSHEEAFPTLQGASNDRWSILFKEDASFSKNLNAHINYQRVSDDYYLQDFTNNLALTTENQLKQEGNVTYTSDHWFLRAKAEAYQTLNPINQAFVSPIYERLPQLYAQGTYDELPYNGLFRLIGQYDQFQWPLEQSTNPSGPRLHMNPIASLSWRSSYGYITPEVQLVENYYHIDALTPLPNQDYQFTIPRYNVDAGLFFDRQDIFMGKSYTQTLEPRLFYLKVPYVNQSSVPAYDAAYMIFTTDQLFRTNRFSGQDRIGDANQLAYALTTRWYGNRSGAEIAKLTVGQLKYFSKRKVDLCYQQLGQCEDNPLMLGYTNPTNSTSPIAAQGVYYLNQAWRVVGDWVVEPSPMATNNGDFNFEYQPQLNHIVRFGYSYLVNGNVYLGRGNEVGHHALHQGTVAYAWPLTAAWSGLGVYSYNVSERYGMLAFLGAQYDSCCWAVRLLGGQVFTSISSTTLKPQYNNNIYIQVLLKGLGTVGNSDSANTIQSYLPGYVNPFQR